MVSAEEYFFYLRFSFIKHGIWGCRINKKVNNHNCIYMEDGQWVVSYVRRGENINPTRYDVDYLWYACEDFINRACKDEEKRKKVWMDWASPTNWAEKMDDVPLAIKVEKGEDGKYRSVDGRPLEELYEPHDQKTSDVGT